MPTGDSLLKAVEAYDLPPVEKWNPDYCGAIDIHIHADGSWFYQGTPIGRKRLQKLFSRIIKKQGEDYFLVTPVEKVSIKVDWLPFTIVDFEMVTINNQKVFRFTDNCENQFDLTDPSQFKMSHFQSQDLPCVNVRRDLFAGFSRSCYYNLIAEAEETTQQGVSKLQITSAGQIFCLGEYPQNQMN